MVSGAGQSKQNLSPTTFGKRSVAGRNEQGENLHRLLSSFAGKW